MNPLLADVLQVLRLERLELDLFRGESRDPGHHRVFGGQVLGQALAAACATVDERSVHSLHAYFLRAGDPDHPIVYEVDRSRDGTSFASRRVVAIQHGQQIFHMSASFQVEEHGVDRQARMPAVPAPETLPDLKQVLDEMRQSDPSRPRPFLDNKWPFEFRAALLPHLHNEVANEPRMEIWFRAVDRLPDDQILHRSLLAYASDYHLLSVATMDERLTQEVRGNLQMASIDHAMWFHRPARVDEWLLYVLDSPSSSGSRGFARGSIFNRQGVLIASLAQEGLLRQRPANSGKMSLPRELIGN
jgi:acyl-CoA thioesterase-2